MTDESETATVLVGETRIEAETGAGKRAVGMTGAAQQSKDSLHCSGQSILSAGFA